MSEELDSLLSRRATILAQLKTLDRGEPGGNPNISAPSMIDHVGYRKSLYEELKDINALITSMGGPWEVKS